MACRGNHAVKLSSLEPASALPIHPSSGVVTPAAPVQADLIPAVGSTFLLPNSMNGVRGASPAPAATWIHTDIQTQTDVLVGQVPLSRFS